MKKEIKELVEEAEMLAKESQPIEAGNRSLYVLGPALCAVIRETDDRVQKTIEMIFRYGMIDGAHHKQWCLDQALRLLLGDEYDARIKQENADEEYAPWDEGCAP